MSSNSKILSSMMSYIHMDVDDILYNKYKGFAHNLDKNIHKDIVYILGKDKHMGFVHILDINIRKGFYHNLDNYNNNFQLSVCILDM